MRPETRTIRFDESAFIKMENELPSGSHKHRLAESHIKNAKRLGKKKITVGSCGNYGYSIFMLAVENDMLAQVFLPAETHINRLCQVSHPSLKIEFHGNYEESVEKSSRFALENPDYYDANCFGPNEGVSLDAYAPTADEIIERFSLRIPEVARTFRIWIPVGNGTTLASVHKRMISLGIQTTYGIVSSKGNSSPTRSMLEGRPIEIPSVDVRLSAYNQPLVNQKAVPNTLELIDIAKGNKVVEVEDHSIAEAKQALDAMSVKAQPQGCAALAAYLENKDDKETHLVLITA